LLRMVTFDCTHNAQSGGRRFGFSRQTSFLDS
jgi:hypothetical protein